MKSFEDPVLEKTDRLLQGKHVAHLKSHVGIKIIFLKPLEYGNTGIASMYVGKNIEI